MIAPDLQCEYLGQSPRRKLSNYVFTSTELPPHYPIPQHAEMSFYYDRAPHSLFFWCATASRFGGATPLTDLRRVVQALDPEVREAFEQRGVRHNPRLRRAARQAQLGCLPVQALARRSMARKTRPKSSALLRRPVTKWFGDRTTV